MYPLKMSPVFMTPIWGGNRMKEHFNKDIPSETTGESWEISCHKDGLSFVANGEFTGTTLSQICRDYPLELMGTLGKEHAGENIFPLMFKIIDAQDCLSVQVHPDDEYANLHENGGLGKTELWYVLHADPGSQIVFGLREGVDKNSFSENLKNGTLESQLNYIDVSPGDTFFIPAGTIHAIGAGLIIAEIQQNSNSTYRVYDYNRLMDGKPRELHVEKALDVSDFTPVKGNGKTEGVASVDISQNSITHYIDCKYFSFEKIDVLEKYENSMDGSTFEILFFAEGEGSIIFGESCESFAKGDTFLIPASLPSYEITGKSTVLKSYIKE